MIAAPRLPTFGRKSSRSTPDRRPAAACSPRTCAWNRSGYIVGEWLPQTPILRDIGHGDLQLGRQLRDRAVVIEAQHRGEPLVRDVGSVVHRDQAVRVRRVAHDEHFHVIGGRVVQRLALDGEDLAVLAQQLGALHALRPRPRADQQRDVDAVERVVRVVVQIEPGQQRKGAVDQLHRDAIQRAHRGRNLEQAQIDGLVGAEQLPGGDAEDEAVADLTGCAGDGDSYGILLTSSSPG